MTDINPQNFQGAKTTLVGYTAADARPPAYDREGTKGILELSIPINEGYKKDGEFVKTGTTWYTYSAAAEFAQNVLAPIKKGSKVRIDNADQEVREYQDKDGVTQKAITLKFGTVTVLAGPSAPAGEPF